MPAITNKRARCILFTLEAIDENDNTITDLIVSLGERTVRSTNPLLEKDYIFRIKATSSQGVQAITTMK